MPSFGSETGNVLYLIVCAAPPARDTPELVEQLQADGWDVCVVATPSALEWFDLNKVADLTRRPVRHSFRRPDDEGFEPKGDAILVSPATFNTINKWALGISDSLALGLLNEALGAKLDIEVDLCVNDLLRRHPAWKANVAQLSNAQVKFL